MSDTEKILFGSDSTERIVAVEVSLYTARIYRRTSDGVVTDKREFRRWLLTTQQHPLEKAEWTRLEGGGYNWIAEFDDKNSYNNARYWLRDSHALHIAIPGTIKQYLVRSGQTFFKRMSYDDVLRLQLDIETLGLDPRQPENKIFLVSITDNQGFETLISGDEADILRQTIRCIQERDPDIIEGHNIIGFDFPYLMTRAKMLGIRLSYGRDNSEPVFGAQQNCAIGYYTRPFVPIYIHGRHVIDTLLAVQRYDVGRASLSSHSLKAVCDALCIAEPDRVIIPHELIASEWETNPERVRVYAMQDAKETRSLAALICPPEFYLTQMIPDTYSSAVTSGTGEKINSLFIREYLRNGRAIPEQSQPKPLPGGYTEVRQTGVIKPIVKCDVESLYPSLMLTNKIKPESDTLGIFLPMLEELTKRRFDAKKKAKNTTEQEHSYWDGMQSAFKILINSFYGYLGGPFNFNDYDAAATVTTTGQSIVKMIVDELEKTGSLVVEIDTDGVYFKPPSEIDSEEKEVEYIESIGSILPEGIHLAHDGRYKAMISLKIKNYVLLSYDEKKTFKGSSLRSRADERFGLEFISEAVDYLLAGKKDSVRELYHSVADQIDNGNLPLDKFTRRERITEKTFISTNKKRVAQAAGKAKVGDHVNVYQKNDGSLGLAENYENDEDRRYLLEKLYKFACRLHEAFGDDFDVLFPKPSPKTKSESAGQQSLELF